MTYCLSSGYSMNSYSIRLLAPFFFYCSAPHRDLHSFPTRRSSDLFRTPQRPRTTVRRRGWDRSLSSGSIRPEWREYRSEEHTSNSSHGYISYAVFCLKKKKRRKKSFWDCPNQTPTSPLPSIYQRQ